MSFSSRALNWKISRLSEYLYSLLFFRGVSKIRQSYLVPPFHLPFVVKYMSLRIAWRSFLSSTFEEEDVTIHVRAIHSIWLACSLDAIFIFEPFKVGALAENNPNMLLRPIQIKYFIKRHDDKAGRLRAVQIPKRQFFRMLRADIIDGHGLVLGWIAQRMLQL